MSDATRASLTMDELRARGEDILQVARRYGAFNVRVFGSVARGEAGPESDVDFIVQFQDGASLYDLSGMKQDLETLLGCRVDVVGEHAHMKEGLLRRILRDAVAI